jgi:hypothetical protein
MDIHHTLVFQEINICLSTWAIHLHNKLLNTILRLEIAVDIHFLIFNPHQISLTPRDLQSVQHTTEQAIQPQLNLREAPRGVKVIFSAPTRHSGATVAHHLLQVAQ